MKMLELEGRIKIKIFGYKAEFVMTTDERIITSVRTSHGAYIDGTYADEMLEETKKLGLT